MTDSPQTARAFLTVEQTGQTFPLDQELLTIGRKSGNTIVLAEDVKVSRHHANIVRQDDHYLIQDVGSANGTYLNNERLTEPRPLNDGDVIQMGDTTFTVRLPLPDTQPSLRPAPVPEVEETIVSTMAELDVDTTMMRVGRPLPVDNPYVGPRTFTQQESDRFFGREREAQELFSLVISERLTLFYAQSGAGKSSLINARLVPQLREAGFPVLPIGRVSGQLPEGMSEVDNIFIFNLLLSMDESDGPPNRFAQMPLNQFLTKLTSLDGQHYYYDEESASLEVGGVEENFEQTPYVLIIDQFEEIITTHPERWQDREGFFKQLDQAMSNDPLLWVVLTLREDYVANLDPYIHLIPGKLRARFYMQRMDHEAALEAVKKPADQYGRPFGPGVAEDLVDNLRQIRIGVPSSGQVETQPGQFVEPVQLQVVCYQLWENLKDKPAGEITQQDLQELGDVDTALAQFYEQAIAEVIQKTDVTEIELRNWFDTQLVTEVGTRGTVYRGKAETGGLPNRAVDLLVSKYLLRAEVRSGGTWYELVHDRLVEPIRLSNHAWSLKQPLIQMAQDWDESGRNVNKLLEGQQLNEALATNWRGLGYSVEEFITASQEAQRVKERALQAEREAQRQRELEQARILAEEQRLRAEEQARASRRLRLLAVGMTIITIVAITAAIVAVWSTLQAQFAQAIAVASQEDAEDARATAEWNQYQASANEATADAERATAQYASTAAVEQKSTAEAASTEALDQQAAAIAAQETAIAERDVAIQARETQAAILEAFLTAEAVPDTPTPTATATATPSEPPTPATGPTPTATYTPTSAPTPTPNQAIEAAQVELENIRATQTVAAELQATEVSDVEATKTAVARQATEQAAKAPSPPPPLDCKVKPAEEFVKDWEEYKSRLGCPQTEPIRDGLFAEQPFENGFMFWSEQVDKFVVTIGEDKGIGYLIDKTDFDPDGAGCEPSIPKASPDLIQPVRGFGGIWCDRLDIQRAIGYGTKEEYGVRGNLLQLFDRGVILRDSNNLVYIVFLDDNSYIRRRF